MHGSLKEHLHSEECMVFIRAYQKCHDENKFGKFFGACNNIEETMKRCCREERLKKMKMNRESAFKKANKIKEEA